ncbi:GNAT family N-acetyltransferase [Gallaecimonas sp. GXIMD4217]|uniref:tRNA(Met) cytidine acetyltransferase TmcA n=1 Tax=Gallaecimonas sp. GXIMD4217 TaxID=3131927 RepID=UPI00311B0369
MNTLERARTLWQEARTSWQRRWLCLEGDKANQGELLAQLAGDAGRPLWLGEGAPAAFEAVRANQVRHQLGRECDLLVVDWHDGIQAEALGALSGCLVGGGLLVLLTPPLAKLERQSPFSRWLVRQLDQAPSSSPRSLARPSLAGPTEDQQQALAAIDKVVKGHRRRPLVLTADRGRGKSAALGMAAARLLPGLEGPILVTAPSPQAVAPLFDFAEAGLPGAERHGNSLSWQGKHIRFLAPDALLADRPKAALLLVDEAAAIPTPLLSRMLDHYARLVFSTTLHGYEGSGRGFAVRFQAELKRRCPQYQRLHLKAPVRWADGDPLEALINRLLLLDAELPQAVPGSEPLSFRWCDGAELVQHPQWLSQAMALLVQAHYQTSPGDLQHWLEDPEVRLLLGFQGDSLVGVVALVAEGGLDEPLAEAVWLGQRRPKGHLFLQSLSAHLGAREAVGLRAWRVMRIAVLPGRQGRGLGSRLLREVERAARERQLDLLGVSFGATAELLPFWRRQGWQPVRLGSHRDQASGTYSVMLALGLNEPGRQLVARCLHRFRATLPVQMPALRLPFAIWRGLFEGAEVVKLDDWDRQDLDAFVRGNRPLESLELALRRLALLASAKGLDCPLLVALSLSRLGVGELADGFGLNGRKAVLAALREEVSGLVQRVP